MLVTGIYFVSNRLWKIPVERRRLALSSVIFISVLFAGAQIAVPGLLASLGLKAALLLAACAAFYLLVLDRGEKDWLAGTGAQLRVLLGKGAGPKPV